MPFSIIRQDITKLKVDVIVNAANTGLQMGGGVCGAIFNAAGEQQLRAACEKLAPIQIGEAVITPGFALPAKYIIHTAGPVYSPNNSKQCERFLRLAYENSLRIAIDNQCTSIAFPLISSGIYGYPKDQALQTATAVIQDFLMQHEIDVTLALFDKASFAISKKRIGDVESYIDEHYVADHTFIRRALLDVERDALFELEVRTEEDPAIRYTASSSWPKTKDDAPSAGLDDFVGKLDEPFSTMLLRLIDRKGKTDVEVYKRANLDRKLFSKIRTAKGYMPSKRTAIALAVALELTLEETDDLLQRAGYALSHSQKFDVIVEYFIVNGKYDIFEINEVLFQYDQPTLGG